jgi:hypothetical protein
VYSREVTGESLRCFEIRFLDHIRRIDAALQAAIHPQGDHLLEPRAMPFQEGRPTLLVPVLGSPQEIAGLIGIDRARVCHN